MQLLDVIPMGIVERADSTYMKYFARIPPCLIKKIWLSRRAMTIKVDAMRIYQGENKEAKTNAMLGEFEFGNRQGPQGAVRVQVVFDCGVDGIPLCRAA